MENRRESKEFFRLARTADLKHFQEYQQTRSESNRTKQS